MNNDVIYKKHANNLKFIFSLIIIKLEEIKTYFPSLV